MKFHHRYLKHGEKLRGTDEFRSSNDGKWYSFKDFYSSLWNSVGKETHIRHHRGSVPVRRKIKH